MTHTYLLNSYILTYLTLTFLPTYLPPYLSTYLLTTLPTYYHPTYLPNYLPTYHPTYLFITLPTFLSPYLPTYHPTSSSTTYFLPTYITIASSPYNLYRLNIITLSLQHSDSAFKLKSSFSKVRVAIM